MHELGKRSTGKCGLQFTGAPERLPSHSRVDYVQYIRHLREDLGIDTSHFLRNVDAMADGYLKAVTDADSRLRTILGLKLEAPGFG